MIRRAIEITLVYVGLLIMALIVFSPVIVPLGAALAGRLR